MNESDDDRLGRALREEAGRDLPGPEFGRRVMEAVEEERERSRLEGPAPSPTSRILRVAAALGFVALGIWAVASGTLGRPGSGGDVGMDLARDGLELPLAKSARPAPRPLKITVTAENAIRVEGRKVEDDGELPARLVRAATREFTEGEVVLRIDRRVPWRSVLNVLRACAHPDVRLHRVQFAVTGPGGPALLPESLPPGARPAEDPAIPEGEPESGLEARPFPNDAPVVSIVLERAPGQDQTLVHLLGVDLGEGDTGLRVLGERLASLLNIDASLPASLSAWPEVPYEEVIRALDLWHGAGGGSVSLIGIASRPR